MNLSNEEEIILVRSPNWLGDAVFCTPSVFALKQKFPHSKVVVLTNANLCDLWRLHRSVSDVVVRASDESVFQTARKVARIHATRAIIFPNSIRSALEAYLGRVPVRIGYADAVRRFLLTDPVFASGGTPRLKKRSAFLLRAKAVGNCPPSVMVEDVRCVSQWHQMKFFLRLVGDSSTDNALDSGLVVPGETVNAFRSILRAGASYTVGLVPGAAYGRAKQWPAEYFAELVRIVSRKSSVRWVIFGSRSESEIGRIISQSGSGVLNLCGKTSLSELTAGLSACDVVVANDTGPLHLAAALGVSVIGIYGSTSPQHTGPIPFQGVTHTVVKAELWCSPCFRRSCPLDFKCMRSISPDIVADVVWRKLRAKGI